MAALPVRINRAIADMALARSAQSPQRFYGLSAQIRQERNEYYAILESTQKSSLDITPWMKWFLACMGRAIGNALPSFWQTFADFPWNDRQRRIVNRLLDGFEGHLTTSKYATLAKCSQDTALRHIEFLLAAHILTRNPAGGRSTSYSLATR